MSLQDQSPSEPDREELTVDEQVLFYRLAESFIEHQRAKMAKLKAQRVKVSEAEEL